MQANISLGLAKMIQALSVVWGQEYIDQFLKGTVKSLSLKHNQEAMSKVIWNIFTDEEDFSRIDEFIIAHLPNAEVRYKSLSLLRDRIDYLHSGMIWQIKECLRHNAKMLLVPPDSIFGDKTVPNLIKLGRDDISCVFVPHPRALPSILDEPYQSNASLVKAAFKHLHRSWSDAEEGTDRQNSFIGGVSWERLDELVVKVKHLLPTPYFCHFTVADLDFFEKAPGIGVIDHVWPSTLVQHNRGKFVGSSDACFIVELTAPDKNLPPVHRGADTNQFWQKHPHNIFNSQLASIFRSE